MPTVKPRVTVMLEPDDYAILSTLAELQGVSKSSLLASLWASACPVMTRVAKLLTEAKNAQESVIDGIREATETALTEIQPMANQVMMNFDLFEESVLEQLARPNGGIGGGMGIGGADDLTHSEPPSSNTGVRFLKPAFPSTSKRARKS